MAILVAFGVMNVWAIVVLAAVLVGEKLLAHGGAGARLAAVAFNAVAIAVVAAPRDMIVGMPFTCESCGGRTELMPSVGDVLRCPRCGDERPFVRHPLLVVTGTAGSGKSTLCARLAGTIPGVVLLDADILADDLVSVVPPNQDYRAFWRSMMRLAHELAQNDLVVAYFSTMLPEQALANHDVLGYFASVHFLCLTCPPDLLGARLSRRDGAETATARLGVWVDFNTALVASASELPTATVVDAGRAVDEVERDVRRWIRNQLVAV